MDATHLLALIVLSAFAGIGVFFVAISMGIINVAFGGM